MHVIDDDPASLRADTVSAYCGDAFEETVSRRLYVPCFNVGEVNAIRRDRNHGAPLSDGFCADVEAWLKRRRGVVEDEALLVQNGETQRCNRKACNAKTRLRGE